MHAGLEVILLVKLVLQTLTVHQHVLLITLHNGRLLKITQIGLHIGLHIGRCLLRKITTQLGDILRLLLQQILRTTDVDIGIHQVHLDGRQCVLEQTNLLHHKGLRGTDTIIHLVELLKLGEEEQVLVAENSPVRGQETQAHILLTADLLVALQKHLGLLLCHLDTHNWVPCFRPSPP